MKDTPTAAAARKFLALLFEGPPPPGRKLLRALDELAAQYHQTPRGRPPDRKGKLDFCRYWTTAQCLKARFPHYGYYVLSDPTKTTDATGMVSNAIDDLSDIANDLQHVIWTFENDGAEGGHWRFRFLFEIHWVVHLRELFLYLHTNAFRPSRRDSEAPGT